MTARAERIAVTGVGAVSALGVGARTTFARLVRGERAVAPVTLFDTQGARCRLAAEIPSGVLGTALRDAPSRTDALAVLAAREALDVAQLSLEDGELGVVVGGTTGTMLETEEDVRAAAGAAAAERGRRLVTMPLSSTVSTLEAALRPLRASAVVCSACSSGAVALIEGVSLLLSGRADVVLAGGADALCRMTFAGFDALGALDPEPCRPFDVARRGLTLGEGAAFVVLERESRARARGAPVLAWLGGFALGAEAHHVTHPDPSGAPAAALIRRALERAGRTPRELDYVNAHGTGTPANDAMEALALRLALQDECERIRISSSKGQLGHTLGAAGALEAVITVLALDEQVAPPTAGLEQPEAPTLRHVRGEGEAARLRTALSSSFGFGGMSAVLVFDHPETPPPTTAQATRRVVITAAVPIAVELGSAASSAAAALLDPERSRRFDGATAWATHAVETARREAALSASDSGLVVGSAYGTVERTLRFLDRIVSRGLRAAPPAEFPHLVPSALVGNVSIYHGLTGPVAAVSGGALSGGSALARALGWIETAIAETMIAGALEAGDPIVAALAQAPLRAGAARRSEGGGFVVLESEGQARARGARALATIVEHVEERGPVPRAAAWSAPVDPRSARVVIAPSDDGVAELVRASSWRDAPAEDLVVRFGHHEALSALALALGTRALGGAVRAVLVVSGGLDARYVTHLSMPEATE